MRALTDKQVDAEHIASNLGHLIAYAKTRDHGTDWDAALLALLTAMDRLRPMTKREAA